MTRYMLDTNIVSHFVRAHPEVDRRIVGLPVKLLCISAITEGELLFGMALRPQARGVSRELNELLRRLDVLPWDRDVAARYGVLRAGQQRQGRPLAPMDLLIAAHALSAGAILVTSDQAFRHVEGLAVEDWTAPARQ